MNKIKPVGDNVFLKKDEPLKITKLGIHLPSSAQEKPIQGVVVAVGPGVFQGGHFRPLQVQPGDRVVFSQYAGVDTKVGQDDLFCVHEESILAVLE